jgi:hypothetical protein
MVSQPRGCREVPVTLIYVMEIIEIHPNGGYQIHQRLGKMLWCFLRLHTTCFLIHGEN